MAIAIALGLLILWVGLRIVSGIARIRPPGEPGPPEDVADLAVAFVCSECGTELRVAKLGELQVPRHCGEPMRVVQRD